MSDEGGDEEETERGRVGEIHKTRRRQTCVRNDETTATVDNHHLSGPSTKKPPGLGPSAGHGTVGNIDSSRTPVTNGKGKVNRENYHGGFVISIAMEAIPAHQVGSFAGILWEFTGVHSTPQPYTGDKDLSLALAFSIPSLQLFLNRRRQNPVPIV
ncbi:hypothetical protein BDP81DRAFT_121362 [Colletotrichum phormii]|uniref:Uncharacterized protein n=1 Tax=Colletotrichum phormii TaxID=359342 RepID=A0AAI9ZGY1_9PEZI|nr:uncharacterized protein BDP81DRAFT_121362 [Colletotrichum phormii]KAK1623380.1 hypothetical protein BDP81DRAFT_121362 [Colletotrichum phormii]